MSGLSKCFLQTLLAAAGVAVSVPLAAPVVSPQTPAATIFNLAGKPVDPFREAAGKIVVLIFVRTDCPVSNRYAPAIQELSARNASHAAFFLVYPIRSETVLQIREHLRQFGYQLPVVRDPELSLARASHVTITPEVAVFSSGRTLLYHGRIDNWYQDFGRSRPAATTHELSDALAAAVAGKPVAKESAPAVGCFIPGAT